MISTHRTRVSIACIALFFLFAIVACSSLYTHSDYDPTVSFSEYKVFAWSGTRQSEHSQDIGDQMISALNLQRIERAIESELMQKGFQHANDPALADFLITFSVGVRDKVDIDSYPRYDRDRWVDHWPYEQQSIKVHTYTEGTLAIDIYDRMSTYPIWHGIAQKQIARSHADNAEYLIQHTVAKILSDFPPR